MMKAIKLELSISFENVESSTIKGEFLMTEAFFKVA